MHEILRYAQIGGPGAPPCAGAHHPVRTRPANALSRPYRPGRRRVGWRKAPRPRGGQPTEPALTGGLLFTSCPVTPVTPLMSFLVQAVVGILVHLAGCFWGIRCGRFLP